MVQSVETRETPLDPLILDFARPGRTLFWMGFVLVQAAILVAVFWVPLETAFRYNPIFNGVIVAVLAVGILVAMFQVARLNREIRWLQAFSRNESAPPPRLLAPLARQLTPLDHRSMQLTPTAARAILDGVQIRLDEQRDLTRYLTGLLVFLGLLGTFWGLIGTIRAVAEIVAGLEMSGDPLQVFLALKSRIEEPLGAMGTAFSTSLFGLAGSLLLGLLDLQAGHATNRFYNQLEEWLAGWVRLKHFGWSEEESTPAYLAALLDQTAESLDKLRRLMQEQQGVERDSAAQLVELNAQVGRLVTLLSRESREIEAINELHGELRALVRQLAQLPTQQRLQLDELRDELRLLAKGLSAHSNLRAPR